MEWRDREKEKDADGRRGLKYATYICRKTTK
jgi:hypothetical protein